MPILDEDGKAILKGKMYILPPEAENGVWTETILEEPPTLEKMQGIIGGYVEMVYSVRIGKAKGIGFLNIPDLGKFAFQMYVDEEGKLKKLPRNNVATNFYHNLYHLHQKRKLNAMPLDYLVGTAVILIGDAVLWT